jgi:hypothetical protein
MTITKEGKTFSYHENGSPMYVIDNENLNNSLSFAYDANGELTIKDCRDKDGNLINLTEQHFYNIVDLYNKAIKYREENVHPPKQIKSHIELFVFFYLIPCLLDVGMCKIYNSFNIMGGIHDTFFLKLCFIPCVNFGFAIGLIVGIILFSLSFILNFIDSNILVPLVKYIFK